MVFSLMLLIMPKLIFAKIEVHIFGEFNPQMGLNATNLTVTFEGNDVGVITDTEMNTFKLNDLNLKHAVNTLYGKCPNDAFLRNPTPWGDLYKKYGWQEVTRTLTPRGGNVVKVLGESVIIHYEMLSNYGESEKRVIKFHKPRNLLNTISSSWRLYGLVSIFQNISYDVKLKVADVAKETSFSYTSPWGQDMKQSQVVTVGRSSYPEIILDPGQIVFAMLYVTKRTILVEIEYVASLSGRTVVSYFDSYEDDHFCALDISCCMRTAGLNNRVVSREVITIEFYEDTLIHVRDTMF